MSLTSWPSRGAHCFAHSLASVSASRGEGTSCAINTPATTKAPRPSAAPHGAGTRANVFRTARRVFITPSLPGFDDWPRVARGRPPQALSHLSERLLLMASNWYLRLVAVLVYRDLTASKRPLNVEITDVPWRANSSPESSRPESGWRHSPVAYGKARSSPGVHADHGRFVDRRLQFSRGKAVATEPNSDSHQGRLGHPGCLAGGRFPLTHARFVSH